MKYIQASMLGVALLGISGALPVSASVIAQVGGSVNVDAGVRADVNPSYSNKESSSADDANSRAVIRANANSAVGVTSSTSSYNTLSGGRSSSAASEGHSNEFAVTRADLSGTSTVVEPARVSTSNDLAAYARSVMTTDQNVSRIESNDSQVSVWYDEPVRLLGIIPVTVPIQAAVDASGTVTVGYPWWYGIFVKDDRATQFQNDLSVTAGTIARVSAGTSLSSNVKARVINALRSVMKARYESSVSATTSAAAAY